MKTRLTRTVTLRGGFQIPFWGLSWIVLLVLGVPLVVAHRGSASVAVGAALVTCGLACLVGLTRRSPPTKD